MRPGAGLVPGPLAAKASNASDATRQRPPTRRAGRRPLAIQRWTERVVAPIRAAARLGLSSSDMSGAIVAWETARGKIARNATAGSLRPHELESAERAKRDTI
jgi:hypothetical protein